MTKNRVQRALELLHDALRWSRRHDKQAKAKRLKEGIDVLTPKDHPAAPPPAPPKPAVTKVTYPALTKARNQSHNGPRFSGPNNGAGQCRLQCRLCLGTASVGDFDHDGRADAEDAWKAAKRKHPGDRKPPRGFPVFWAGGSHDDGHEALSAGVPGSKLGNALRRLFGRANETWVWSTDILRDGYFDYVPMSLIEQKWGLSYLGWTEDDNGITIQPTKEIK